ncbi:MAG: M90 family metallopeptidase [Pseudomonadota bacterium]
MLSALRAWRRRRMIRRHALPEHLWQEAAGNLYFLDGLNANEWARLRELATLFLAEKHVNAAGGLVLTDAMRVNIAAQACLLILNLDLDYYGDWVELIVYPGDFIAEASYTDQHGIVHELREPRSGESWLKGPVVLSWDAVACGPVQGINVVIHEFAHKLDMLNGNANGYPPLHRGMSRGAWSAAFSTAYEDFCHEVDAGMETWLDEYASNSPAEFFAVASEAFFIEPRTMRSLYPAVYEQLQQFYRQDPLARLKAREPS